MDSNHYLIIFSKVITATSVNDMNMDLRKWIMMAQIVNNTINLLSGKRPNIQENIFEDWLIWIPRLPNKDTALTSHSTLWYSKPIQELNGRQARQSCFLSKQPNRDTEQQPGQDSITWRNNHQNG